MKLTRFLLIGLLFTSVCLQQVSAQNEDYRHVFSVNAGLNVFQFLGSATFYPAGSVDFNSAKGYGSPTFQVGYDYGFKKWFSLGVAFAHNRFGAKYTDLNISNRAIGNLDMRYSRNTITSRVLFHYGNSGRLDMYSGLRIGASIWSSKPSVTLSESESIELIENGGIGSAKGNKVIPHFGMTLFGLRYYVTENLGLGFESNIGNYLASIQVNYRLGGTSAPVSKSSTKKKK